MLFRWDIYLIALTNKCQHYNESQFPFQSNIKARNIEAEVNSEVLKNKSYLEDIELFYKHEFLKEMSQHSELLVYDWSNGGEPEIVTEDVVRIGT